MASKTLLVSALLLFHPIFLAETYFRDAGAGDDSLYDFREDALDLILRHFNQYAKRKSEQRWNLQALRRQSFYEDEEDMIKRGEVTEATGRNQPFNNMQDSFVLYHALPTSDTDALPVVRTFAFRFDPESPTADGRMLQLHSNAHAFSMYGTTYGGDGKTNFALPDLQGRVIIGVGQGNGLSSYKLGQKLGTGNITLTMNQMPAHTHTMPKSPTPTGQTGGSQPFDNVQPSLVMNYIICVNGNYPVRGSSILVPFIGQIAPLVGSTVPNDWRLANGDSLSISANPALFSVIGTTYGGDGKTTFQLPDLRGRVPIGAGPGSKVKLGEKVGLEPNTVLINNLPSHYHFLPQEKYAERMTGSTGNGQPIENRQPSLGITYFMCTQGVYPSRHDGPSFTEDPIIGEVFGFAGNFAPDGAVMTDGRFLSVSQNSALFSLLEDTFGGNRITTFAVPDLRDRTILGSGKNFPVGQVLGSSSITLFINHIPSHTHTIL